MSVELIAGIVGFITSLALEYFPKLGNFDLAGWYTALTNAQKKLVAAGIGLVVVFGALGLGCANVLASPYFPCTGQGALMALAAWWAYFTANQVTFSILINRGQKK